MVNILIQTLRPRNFSKLLGNEVNKKIISAIIRNPKNAPRTMIFGGSLGSGKTTSARIFARMINNLDDDFPIENSPYYYELDSSVVGNKDSLKEYQDVFTSVMKDGYKVVVLDEAHVISRAGQTLLLKTLEEAKLGIFFILCTTDVEKLIPTIRSRSLELNFSTQPIESVKEYLLNICNEKGIRINPKIAHSIAYNSGGYMRNAIGELHKYTLIGEEDYILCSGNILMTLCDIFIKANKGESYVDTINHLSNYPMIKVKSEISSLIHQSMKIITTDDYESCDENIAKLVNQLGLQTTQKLVTAYLSDWARNIYDNEMDMLTGIMIFASTVKPVKVQNIDNSLKRVEGTRSTVKL